MAKSLRSKWRRKCRAVKRVRYGQKELERLKKTLGIDESGKPTDVTMSEASDIVTITDAKAIKDTKAKQTESLEMVVDGKTRIFNLKTLKDQNGSSPIWLNQRKVKKSIKKKDKNKKKRKQR